jgi:hypothetical protein
LEFAAQQAALAQSFEVAILPGDAHERLQTFAIANQDVQAELLILAPRRPAENEAALQHVLNDLASGHDHAALVDLSGDSDASLRDAFFAGLEDGAVARTGKNRLGS